MAYRKVSQEQRDEVRRLLAEGKLSRREIANRTGVSLRTVQRERESMQARAGAVPTGALPSAEELPGLEAPAPEGQPAPTPEPGPQADSVPVAAPPAPVPMQERPLLDRLLDELRQASAEQVKALREILAPSAPVVVERLPKGPRRTAAFYISEELIRAIRNEARRQDVAPSQVVEQVLWRAKAAGWLG